MSKITKDDKIIVQLQELKVDAAGGLLNYLLEKRVKGSRNAIKSLLMHKQIKVNGKLTTRHDAELAVGDVVTISKNDHTRDEKKLDGIKIVYEDEYLIVVDKDQRVLSIATERERSATAYSMLSDYVKNKDADNKIFVLHRLDRETSGLMMYARSAEIQEVMQKNWDETILVRSYIAVVMGRPMPTEGTITSWLTENKNFVMFSCPFDNGGQKSITHYKTLKQTRKFTMLNLNLETGRKNQIRVHMQAIGHSIVGDKKYGAPINPIKRMALHAHELNFVHPISKEIMEFKSPIPIKMQLLVDGGYVPTVTKGIPQFVEKKPKESPTLDGKKIVRKTNKD